MRYGFFISGEFPELGFLEVENLLASYAENFEILYRGGRILIVESDTLDEEFFSRLAMVRESFLHLKTVESSNIESTFKDLDFGDKRICVRVKRIKKDSESVLPGIRSPELERKLGALLWQRGARIDLKNPDAIVKVYISEKCHIGILNHVTDTKQFWERRPDRKPFFKPGALLPRLARALVNLTGVRGKFSTLLDPMCGTGTILIEAGLMEIDFCGVEAFPKVAYGCATNLRHYSLPLNLFLGDVRRLPFVDSSFDAVVTDYPYLRSSKSFGHLKDLYERSILEIVRVLKPGKKAVLISNRDLEDVLDDFKGLSLKAKLIQRVHKNLYRRIYLLENLK